MDISYILGREQTSLYNASVASSAPARIAHEGLAKAYGALLAANAFPHRQPIAVVIGPAATAVKLS
jgi:hypothetical protein